MVMLMIFTGNGRFFRPHTGQCPSSHGFINYPFHSTHTMVGQIVSLLSLVNVQCIDCKLVWTEGAANKYNLDNNSFNLSKLGYFPSKCDVLVAPTLQAEKSWSSLHLGYLLLLHPHPHCPSCDSP